MLWSQRLKTVLFDSINSLPRTPRSPKDLPSPLRHPFGGLVRPWAKNLLKSVIYLNKVCLTTDYSSAAVRKRNHNAVRANPKKRLGLALSLELAKLLKPNFHFPSPRYCRICMEAVLKLWFTDLVTGSDPPSLVTSSGSCRGGLAFGIQ